MKKVYVSHSIDHPDFKKELYKPLGLITDFKFIFPHQNSCKAEFSKEIIRNCNLFIADVSFQKLGIGIEIGWADAFDVPILFIYKKGSKLSRSLGLISRNFIEYDIIENKLSDINKLANALAI